MTGVWQQVKDRALQRVRFDLSTGRKMLTAE
jgi:hypothetical protein